MISGLRGYKKMCDTEDSGGRKVNRTRKDGANARRVRKVIGKTNWYKEKKKFLVDKDKSRSIKGGPPIPREARDCSKKVERGTKPKETEAVVFVPCTPGGVLQKRIQEKKDWFTAGMNLKSTYTENIYTIKMAPLFD